MVEILARASHQAETLGNLVLALRMIGEAYGRADAEGRFHLRGLCRWVASRLGPQHGLEPPELPGPLRALITGGAAASPPLAGAVNALLLDSEQSGEGFVVQLVAAPLPEGVRGHLPPGCGPSFAAAVDRAEQLIFRLLLTRTDFRPRASLLARHRFSVQGVGAARTHDLDGASIGLAAAAALTSAWTERPVEPDLLFTGCLGPRGEVLPVAGLEAKVRCALRERPTLRQLFVPREGSQEAAALDPRVVAVDGLEQVLVRVFGAGALSVEAPAAVDVEGTVRLGLQLYEKEGNFSAAREVLQTARDGIARQRLDSGDPGLWQVEEFLCLWRLASCHVHRGDPVLAEPLFVQAGDLGGRLWDRGDLDPRAFFGCRGNLAVFHRDRFEYDRAEALLLDTLDQQRALRQDRREVARTLGNLGELWTFMGKFDEAEQSLLEALGALRAVYRDEVPRELCYLGNLYVRRGDPAQARACYSEGLEENRHVSYGRDRNEVFLRYGLGRAFLALGQPGAALQQVELALTLLSPTEVYPRQFVTGIGGLAHLALGEEEKGRAWLMRAGDPSRADGALIRLGVSVALGHLALHELSQGDEARCHDLLERLLGQAGPLLDRMCPGLRDEVQASREFDRRAATRMIHRVIDSFPY